jgi:O-acetyl-ADP-ribose deacetylase (regulator of RNase III)
MSGAVYQIEGRQLEIRQGDITRAEVDVVVNAANSGLRGGGGVDGAIHAAAGPELLAACREIVQERGQLPPGQAVITPGFDLPARQVIHTVGPIWQGGSQNERELLASAYRSSLRLADENQARTVAFPAISCGVYGYPVDQAAAVALQTVVENIADTEIEKVSMVLFSAGDLERWKEAADRILGPESRDA